MKLKVRSDEVRSRKLEVLKLDVRIQKEEVRSRKLKVRSRK